MWTKNETTGQLQLVFQGELISVGTNIQQNSKGTEFRIGSVKLPNGKVKSCRIYEKSFAHGMTIGTSYKCTATQYQDASGATLVDILMSHLTFTEMSYDEQNAVLDSMPGFPAPINRVGNDENQNKLVEKLSNSFKDQLNEYPTATFNGLMAAILDKYGHEQVDKGFNFYAEAWNNVSKDKLTPQQLQESYNRIFGNIEEDDFSIGKQSQESNPTIENKAVEKPLEPTVEKTNVVTDFVLPIILYLIYISIPIGIFFNAYFKDIFNFKDDFSFSNYENENNNVYFFFFLMFIGGLFLIEKIREKTKNPYVKTLYSENSIKFHFIISVILIAIVFYYLTISIVLIILIWSLFKLDGYSYEWRFTNTVFYKWVKKIFKIKK